MKTELTELMIDEFVSLQSMLTHKRLHELVITFDVDDSDYHVVDGEEGDHGIKTYSYQGCLVATYINNSGDDERVEFTDYGYKLLQERL